MISVMLSSRTTGAGCGMSSCSQVAILRFTPAIFLFFLLYVKELNFLFFFLFLFQQGRPWYIWFFCHWCAPQLLDCFELGVSLLSSGAKAKIVHQMVFLVLHSYSSLDGRYLGIQQVVFGGRNMGDWEEGMTSPEYGYKYFKIWIENCLS